MRAPIVVSCRNGDVLVFGSNEEAEGGMESPDVEDGEYPAAFDADGTRLAVETTPTKEATFLGITSVTLGRVSLREASSVGAAANELRSVLEAEDKEIAQSDAPIHELVERLHEKRRAAKRGLFG